MTVAKVQVLDTEQVAIESLTKHPANARRGNKKRIEKSLREHGQYAPIVVHEATRHILIGNNRWEVARDKLGMTHILVTWLRCTDAQALAIVATDNHSHEDGDYDLPAYLALLEQVQADGYLEAADFAEADLDDLRHQVDVLMEVPQAEPMEPPGPAVRPLAPPTGDSVKTIFLQYPTAQHDWLAAKLAELADAFGVDGPAQVVLALVSREVGQLMPDPEAAGAALDVQEVIAYVEDHSPVSSTDVVAALGGDPALTRLAIAEAHQSGRIRRRPDGKLLAK